jgi:hypothetical protein
MTAIPESNRQVARVAAYGAYGVAAGLIAVYAGLVALTWPVPTGGMNLGIAMVTWISCLVPVVALFAVHVVMANQLLREQRSGRA